MLLLMEPTVVIISIIQAAITIMELLVERAMLSPKSMQELELLVIQLPLVWLVPMPPIVMAAILEWFAR
jgi:hypothetical protein